VDKAPDAFRIISEVASELDVPQHVLRFWESRFTQIRPMKRGGGRRYYRPDDIDLLRGIRHLLYSEGYTIRGVQRLLREQGIGFVQTAWQNGDAAQVSNGADGAEPEPSPARERLLLNILPRFGRSKGAAELDVTEADEEEIYDDGLEVTAPSTAPIWQSGNGSHPQDARPPLAREQLTQLQAALDELGECRRLIDVALTQSD
jgi:DNA-binding transcriptional MerR regulator